MEDWWYASLKGSVIPTKEGSHLNAYRCFVPQHDNTVQKQVTQTNA